jgi:hypothetical protein
MLVIQLHNGDTQPRSSGPRTISVARRWRGRGGGRPGWRYLGEVMMLIECRASCLGGIPDGVCLVETWRLWGFREVTWCGEYLCFGRQVSKHHGPRLTHHLTVKWRDTRARWDFICPLVMVVVIGLGRTVYLRWPMHIDVSRMRTTTRKAAWTKVPVSILTGLVHVNVNLKVYSFCRTRHIDTRILTLELLRHPAACHMVRI